MGTWEWFAICELQAMLVKSVFLSLEAYHTRDLKILWLFKNCNQNLPFKVGFLVNGTVP